MSDIKWRKYFPKKLPRFFNIQSSFSGRFGFFNFLQGKFSHICLVIVFVFVFFKLDQKKCLKDQTGKPRRNMPRDRD